MDFQSAMRVKQIATRAQLHDHLDVLSLNQEGLKGTIKQAILARESLALFRRLKRARGGMRIRIYKCTSGIDCY